MRISRFPAAQGHPGLGVFSLFVSVEGLILKCTQTNRYGEPWLGPAVRGLLYRQP